MIGSDDFAGAVLLLDRSDSVAPFGRGEGDDDAREAAGVIVDLVPAAGSVGLLNLAAKDGVAACAANEDILIRRLADASDEEIVSGPAIQGIPAGTAIQRVVASIAEQHVVAGAAL